jgi:hypothetical protein
MIELSRAQTLGLERLFKKVDVELLGFDQGQHQGDVYVKLVRKTGQIIEFVLMANGRVRKDEANVVQREHIAG